MRFKMVQPGTDPLEHPIEYKRVHIPWLLVLPAIGLAIIFGLKWFSGVQAKKAEGISQTATALVPTATLTGTPAPTYTPTLTATGKLDKAFSNVVIPGTLQPTADLSLANITPGATNRAAPTAFVTVVVNRSSTVIQTVIVPGPVQTRVIIQIVTTTPLASHTPYPTHTAYPTHTQPATQTPWIVVITQEVTRLVTVTPSETPTPTETPTDEPTGIIPTFPIADTETPTPTATPTETPTLGIYP